MIEPETAALAAGQQRRAVVERAVKDWRGQLIDLGGRNQLLHYRDLKVGTLDLAGAHEVAVEALLAGRAVSLSRLFGAERLPEAIKRARAIRNKAREATEERGISVLFLASGMATWTNTRTAATPAAPVLLREAALSPLGVSEDDFDLTLTGDADVNPSLLHLLHETYGLSIGEDSLLDLLAGPGKAEPGGVFERLAKQAAAVPGFAVRPRLVLGTFSYAKLPMVEDLDANLEALIEHDVIAAIAGDAGARSALLASGAPGLTPASVDATPPRDEFLVLDADSSQSYAINQVVGGASLVVKGPPGTGKSQTIANLISTLTARGQKVLFVAEKRAAIDAVTERLRRLGLGDLVLDLHEGVGSKRKVAQNLAAALASASQTPATELTEVHERVVTRRDRLNRYSSAVNEARAPWLVSVADLYGELLSLQQRFGGAATTDITLAGQVLDGMTPETRREVRENLLQYANMGGLHLTAQDSPWVGARITSADQARAAFDAAQRLSTTTLPRARTALTAVLAETGLRPPQTVEGWTATLGLLDRTAATLGRLAPECFGSELPVWRSATATRKWRKAHPEEPGADAGWGQRRKLRKQAKALWLADHKPKTDELHAALDAAHSLRAEWSDASVDGGVPHLPADLAGAAGTYTQLGAELSGLGAYLTMSSLTALPEEQLHETVSSLARDEVTLRKVPTLNRLRAALDQAGLGPLLDELSNRRPVADVAVAAFEECFARSLLRRLSFAEETLASFDATEHDRAAQEYARADEEHIATTTIRVRRAVAERLVHTQNAQPEQEQLVRREAAKKQQHLPLRQLFQAAPDVMTAVKPCWAMSPLVVSQLLPGDRQYFDVVIFDEASQIVPADAVPAILRARRVVVAGDEHQLPPTNFFAAASDSTDGEQPVIADDGSINLALTTGFESVLDVMNAFLNVSALRWHYRSRDERLIAFSNAHIYDRSLVTFPGVTGAACLQHVLVRQAPGAGQEDSATAEVARVVDLVLEHAQQRPHESLGVIAMGIKHADRIDTALRRALHDRPELHAFFDERAKERFFVKNLERVQGDERDAIILSVGYGKSANGTLPHRFGPLNQAGGERRLNVAITRARARMTVVSSFDHNDMAPDKCKADGAKLLRAFLEYAASGGTNLGSVLLEKPALNPFEIDVRDRLTDAGIPLTAQYGVAGYWLDFAASHPNQPGRMVLAFEADGAAYHSSDSARDRDRLRQQQLERMGWTFHRIWSTAWFYERDACIAAAVASYEQAVSASEAADAAAAASLPHYESGGGETDARLPVVPRQHIPGRGPRPGVPAGYPITEYSEGELVSVIHWLCSDTLLRTDDELFDEFMAELGFKRRGSRIRAAFENALAKARG
jgi:very-short-patch-repair endonuclease